MNRVWTEMLFRFAPIISHKSETLKQINLYGGGSIEFWSMEDPDSGRGFDYDRAIIDEAEKAKNLEYSWTKVIRPTLTDRRGDAWFLSTPKGMDSYFYKLFKFEEKFPKLWKSWQMPSRTNPYLPAGEIEEAEMTLDPDSFRQEYLAEFINAAKRPFMYCFAERHVIDGLFYRPEFPLYLSFDFNVNPMTCLIGQHGHDADGEFIEFIDEIRLPNSDIYEVCDRIMMKYSGAHFLVTGDRTGLNRTGLLKNANYYVAIQKSLGIKEQQITLPTNPHYNESIVLCNSILAKHPRIFFDKTNCKETIYDMRYVEWDGVKPIKHDRTKREQQADLFDNVRYYFNTFHRGFVKKL